MSERPKVDQVICNQLPRWREKAAARRNLERLVEESLNSPTIRMTEELWDEKERRIKELHPELKDE
ncbi:MAG: hypothetical protein U0793_03005 [Gemmataceae bacterium]